jgi:membrane protein
VSTVRPDRPSWPTRAYAAVERTIATQRRHRPWFDHLARAGGRYQRTQGDLMAAGVTYFAFLGLFPVLLLVASVIGLVLSGDALLQQELFDAIRDAFPGSMGRRLVDQLSGAIDSAGVVGLIGLAGFLYAGLRTMDKLRIGMERIWKGHVDEPDVLRDNLQDLLALVALGAVGLASLGLTGGVTQATSWVLDLLGLADEPGYGALTWTVGIFLALAVDAVVFLWLLRVVPSTSYPLRLLLPGALFGAAGVEVLKLIGGFYLSLISDSVTASALGGAVGLLVWINLVARFAFFTAAWTATLDSIRAVSPPPVPRVPDGPPVVRPAETRPSSSPARVLAGLLSVGALLGILGSRFLPGGRRRRARGGRPSGGPPGSPPR